MKFYTNANCGFLILSLVTSPFLLRSANVQEPERSGAEKNEWGWLSDQPECHPKLCYPVFYSLTLDAASFAFISSLDRSETGWGDIPSARKFQEAFTKGPHWDRDQ
jgi:hypothetical protein